MTAWTVTTLTKNIYFIFHKSWFQSLTTWDGGNQLTYPVKYHDIGYKEDLKDKEEDARLTGFQVSIFTGLETLIIPPIVIKYLCKEVYPQCASLTQE